LAKIVTITIIISPLYTAHSPDLTFKEITDKRWKNGILSTAQAHHNTAIIYNQRQAQSKKGTGKGKGIGHNAITL